MPPITLFRYIAFRLVGAIIIIYLALSALVMLVDLIENLRFTDKYVDTGGFVMALKLTAMRTPGLVQAMTPFVFLFGTIWMYVQLNRRSEISVMRNAGLSVWRLIGPAAFVAGTFATAMIFLFDPLAARMQFAADQLKGTTQGATSSMVRVLGDGIWLRQRAANSVLLINADSFDAPTATLRNVTVWRIGKDATFRERIDAPQAVLAGESLDLHDARLKTPADRLDHETNLYSIKSNLTPADLTARVVAPETMSIWSLPRYTLLAEAAGLPVLGYHIRFHSLCATPLKLIAMVMVAAVFTMRPWRGGGGPRLVMMSIGAGFGLYILSEFFVMLGESGVAPAALSAWVPPIVVTILAATVLLQIEDG